MVGRAVRQRGANASRPFGSRRFDPCTIRHLVLRAASAPRQPCARRGRSSMAEPLPSKQKMRVRFSLPAPTSPRSSSGRGHRSFKSDGAGSNPARGTNALPLRLAGRAPGFEPGRLGSNPRGAAIFQHRGIAQPVERRFHTPRQPQVRSLLPRPHFAGLAKWEGNGSWPRHEAVRSRQPVRACSSSVERRPPNPRQRGFNSFLARHHRSGRSQRDEAGPQRSCSWDPVASGRAPPGMNSGAAGGEVTK